MQSSCFPFSPQWMLASACTGAAGQNNPENDLHNTKHHANLSSRNQHFSEYVSKFHGANFQNVKIVFKNTSRQPVRRISRTPSEKSASREVTGQPREARCTLANLTRDCGEYIYQHQQIAHSEDPSDIDIWISMQIIYFDTQMTQKYSTAMC